MITTFKDKLESKYKLTQREHGWLMKEREDERARQKEQDAIHNDKSIYIFSNRQKRMNSHMSIIQDTNIQKSILDYCHGFLGLTGEIDDDGYVNDVMDNEHIQRMRFMYDVDMEYRFNMFGYDFNFKLLHKDKLDGRVMYKGVIKTDSPYFNDKKWGFFNVNNLPIKFKNIWIAADYYGIKRGHLKRELVKMLNG